MGANRGTAWPAVAGGARPAWSGLEGPKAPGTDRPAPPQTLALVDRRREGGEASGRQEGFVERRVLPDRRRAARGEAQPTETEPIAALAHELRAPLATFQATLEVLGEYPTLSPDDVRQLVRRLQRGVCWMNGLVENLTTWAEVRDGRLILRRAPLAGCDWIEPALALAQPILDRKGQRVRLSCPTPEPVIDGDALHLGQALVNLLLNAARYGAVGDVIDVVVTVEADCVRVRVTDHGPGIPAEEQGRIFARYVRGVGAERAVAEGQGLGLHIVRTLVALHHGAVGVESTPGHGASFWFTLPRLADPQVAARIVDGTPRWERDVEGLAG